MLKYICIFKRKNLKLYKSIKVVLSENRALVNKVLFHEATL